MGRLRTIGVVLSTAIVVLMVLPGAWVHVRYADVIYDRPEDVPPRPVVIVFGAGIMPDGGPSWMLADRVDAAVELYRLGKVERILMSGDTSGPDHDEVSAMQRYAVERGVPSGRILLDRSGLRTYASSYRAKSVFGIDGAVLVTQGYHLPRAVYLARSFGIDAVGLKAGIERCPGQDYYDLREGAAKVVAWYEVNVFGAIPGFSGVR